jgi:hypothetical protein
MLENGSTSVFRKQNTSLLQPLVKHVSTVHEGKKKTEA